MTFEQWKAACAIYAESVGVGGPDLWADDDPYELAECGEAAFNDGDTPQAFIDDIFADDLASREHDDLMEQEAHCQTFDDEGDYDYDQEQGDCDE